MKLLVTGAAGMLGIDVQAAAAVDGHEVVALSRAALDISDGAAKVNFHYAVRKLRATLGPEPDGASRRGRGR